MVSERKFHDNFVFFTAEIRLSDKRCPMCRGGCWDSHLLFLLLVLFRPHCFTKEEPRRSFVGDILSELRRLWFAEMKYEKFPRNFITDDVKSCFSALGVQVFSNLPQPV